MNRRNYLQTLSALFAVSAFGGCTSAGKQKDASNSETDIAGPALAGEAFDVPAVSEESKNFYLVSDLGRNGYYEQKTIAELNGKDRHRIYCRGRGYSSFRGSSQRRRSVVDDKLRACLQPS